MHGLDYFVYLSCVFFYYLHLASVSTMFMVNKASCVIRVRDRAGNWYRIKIRVRVRVVG